MLHDRANALLSGTVPRSNRSAFGTGRPPITVSPGHATGVSAESPACSTPASAVTILNVEPGGKRPVRASAPAASAAPFWATASSCPVDGCTATSIACCGIGSTASSAAVWTARSSVTAAVVPGFGASSTSVATVPPPASTAATDQPGTPSSCAASAVRTAGRTWRANPASGASSRSEVVNRTPGRSWIAFFTVR